jgi:hypothetical protein
MVPRFSSARVGTSRMRGRPARAGGGHVQDTGRKHAGPWRADEKKYKKTFFLLPGIAAHPTARPYLEDDRHAVRKALLLKRSGAALHVPGLGFRPALLGASSKPRATTSTTSATASSSQGRQHPRRPTRRQAGGRRRGIRAAGHFCACVGRGASFFSFPSTPGRPGGHPKKRGVTAASPNTSNWFGVFILLFFHTHSLCLP